MKTNHGSYKICETCKGRGSKRQRIRKKARLRYQRELLAFQNSKSSTTPPIPPRGHLAPCAPCKGSGLQPASSAPLPDYERYPHVAIIGGGIAGIALAVACLHRQIPFTVYERDSDFNVRAQGYGLTLQQASKAMASLGLFSLSQGIVSTRHLVHQTDGIVVGTWGMRKWLNENHKNSAKRSNIHIARQALRLALLEQLGGAAHVQWNHRLTTCKSMTDGTVSLQFTVNGTIKTTHADLVVGADGIRSSVRNKLLKEQHPLRYLGCIVILGICTLQDVAHVQSPLLDNATVFQTANGTQRLYVMPYNATAVMWQLSFPMSEEQAKTLSTQGSEHLKKRAQDSTPWHDPIPQLIAATRPEQITGYPVYDRDLLNPSMLQHAGPITLIGDAAHPMSPFKGQGANQALLDAIALARALKRADKPDAHWRNIGIRDRVLNSFEHEMLKRSAVKVIESAAAARFLHSTAVLHKSDAPRGRFGVDTQL